MKLNPEAWDENAHLVYIVANSGEFLFASAPEHIQKLRKQAAAEARAAKRKAWKERNDA